MKFCDLMNKEDLYNASSEVYRHEVNQESALVPVPNDLRLVSFRQSIMTTVLWIFL